MLTTTTTTMMTMMTMMIMMKLDRSKIAYVVDDYVFIMTTTQKLMKIVTTW